VEINRPDLRTGAADLPAKLSLALVEAREIEPPEGVAPAHWRLLTTHRVDSFADARWIVGLYRRRWLIEELFRILKTRGFDLERVGIAEGPFEKLAAAALVAGVSVLQLTRERDGQAGRPLHDVFHADEQAALEAVSATLQGKTAKQKNPHPKGSLAFAAWVCARLGGWTGYYGKPGPVVMLRGLHQFRAIQHGWTLAHV
jgi:Transposase DDE domain